MSKSYRVTLRAALVPVAMVSALAVSDAYAQASCSLPSGIYALSVNVGGTCGSTSSNTAQGFFDSLQSGGLRSMNSAYTPVSPATVNANFNTLMMNMAVGTSAAFPGSNVASIGLSIPGLGINQLFRGATRDDSQQLFVDYIKKGNILGQILQYQASNSPTSPISGPGGLIPSVTAADFNANFTDSATNIAAPASAAATAVVGNKTSGLAGVALQYSALDVGNSKNKVWTLPLSYTIRNDIDPRRQLTFSLPITQMDIDGAKAYQGGLGVSYRFPMSDNWTLTPAGKYSIVGSVDLATVSSLYSASLTSTYIWNMDRYDIAMGNMLAYNKTGKFSAGDYSFDPGITNTVLRNGIMLSQPVLGGSKLSAEYSFIDTRYMGTKMYVDNTQEIGFTLGTNKSAFSARTFLRGGVSYLHGKDTKGFNANIGYWF